LSGVPSVSSLDRVSDTAPDTARVVMPEPLPPPPQRGLAAGTADARAIFDGYGFPPLGVLTHYCDKRLIGSDGAITTFDVFHSELGPSELGRLYEQRLSRRGLTRVDAEFRWEVPEGAPVPQRSLTIAKPNAPGLHAGCESEAPSRARSLLTLAKSD
jgi:hypothetical protein